VTEVDVPAAASGGAKLLKLAVEGLPHGAGLVVTFVSKNAGLKSKKNQLVV
jgi:hypothetical protein